MLPVGWVVQPDAVGLRPDGPWVERQPVHELPVVAAAVRHHRQPARRHGRVDELAAGQSQEQVGDDQRGAEQGRREHRPASLARPDRGDQS